MITTSKFVPVILSGANVLTVIDVIEQSFTHRFSEENTFFVVVQLLE